MTPSQRLQQLHDELQKIGGFDPLVFLAYWTGDPPQPFQLSVGIQRDRCFARATIDLAAGTFWILGHDPGEHPVDAQGTCSEELPIDLSAAFFFGSVNAGDARSTARAVLSALDEYATKARQDRQRKIDEVTRLTRQWPS